MAYIEGSTLPIYADTFKPSQNKVSDVRVLRDGGKPNRKGNLRRMDPNQVHQLDMSMPTYAVDMSNEDIQTRSMAELVPNPTQLRPVRGGGGGRRKGQARRGGNRKGKKLRNVPKPPKGANLSQGNWMLCENSEGRKVYSKNDPCYPQCPMPNGNGCSTPWGPSYGGPTSNTTIKQGDGRGNSSSKTNVQVCSPYMANCPPGMGEFSGFSGGSTFHSPNKGINKIELYQGFKR